MTKFYLPSFLLGILFYVFINIKDNKEGATTYDEWCPKPKSGTKREYTANIGENSTKHIILIHTPDEYDDYELLDLSGELIMLYVKKIPTNDEYDISNSAIITSENPDSSEKNDYDEFHLCLNDYQEISAFIADFNKLLNCIKAHQNSINKDDINIIGKNKETFYRHWITYSPKFKDSSIQKWFDLILSKIAKSAIIDINNITLVTTPKYLHIKSFPTFSSKYPNINYIYEDEHNNRKENNVINNSCQKDLLRILKILNNDHNKPK